MQAIADLKLERKIMDCIVLKAIVGYQEGITWNQLSDLTGLGYYNGLGGSTKRLINRFAIDRIKHAEGVKFYPTPFSEDTLTLLRKEVAVICDLIQSMLASDKIVPYRNRPNHDEQPKRP